MSNDIVTAHGFMILRATAIGLYRGVDRDPLEPTIRDDEISKTTEIHSANDIWALYPAGWKRESFRLFSEHRVHETPGDFELVHSREVAYRIVSLVRYDAGVFEVIQCRVFPSIPNSNQVFRPQTKSIGFDIVYPGGDYYSAVKNGLHVNPHPGLKESYDSFLNSFGLFDTVEHLSDFFEAFKQQVPSESSSEFVAVELAEP